MFPRPPPPAALGLSLSDPRIVSLPFLFVCHILNFTVHHTSTTKCVVCRFDSGVEKNVSTSARPDPPAGVHIRCSGRGSHPGR